MSQRLRRHGADQWTWIGKRTHQKGNRARVASAPEDQRRLHPNFLGAVADDRGGRHRQRIAMRWGASLSLGTHRDGPHQDVKAHKATPGHAPPANRIALRAGFRQRRPGKDTIS